MLSALFAIQAVILFAADDAKVIAEANLVRTWKSSAPSMFSIHGNPTITYHADHTFTHKDYGRTGPVSDAVHGSFVDATS